MHRDGRCRHFHPVPFAFSSAAYKGPTAGETAGLGDLFPMTRQPCSHRRDCKRNEPHPVVEGLKQASARQRTCWACRFAVGGALIALSSAPTRETAGRIALRAWPHSRSSFGKAPMGKVNGSSLCPGPMTASRACRGRTVSTRREELASAHCSSDPRRSKIRSDLTNIGFNPASTRSKRLLNKITSAHARSRGLNKYHASYLSWTYDELTYRSQISSKKFMPRCRLKPRPPTQ